MQLLTHFRAAFGSPFSIQRIRFLWTCPASGPIIRQRSTNTTFLHFTGNQHITNKACSWTPLQNTVRTVGFHILLYINIIPKQHVRSPVTLNVTSGVVNALGCVLGISNICHRRGTGYADVRGCHGDELEPFAFANLQTVPR